MAVISAGGTMAATSGELSLALWQRFPIEECLTRGLKSCNLIKAVSNTSLLLNPYTMTTPLLQSIHAIGVFSGVSATLDLARAGISGFTYRMTL
jgi:hypothetical protein